MLLVVLTGEEAELRGCRVLCAVWFVYCSLAGAVREHGRGGGNSRGTPFSPRLSPGSLGVVWAKVRLN